MSECSLLLISPDPRLLARLFPLPLLLLHGSGHQNCQWGGNLREVLDKLPVIPSKPKKSANILQHLGCWPVPDCFHPGGIWLNSIAGDTVSNVYHLFFEELALFWCSFETSVMYTVKDLSQPVHMFFIGT